MKIRMNFLMIITLVVCLAFTSIGAAASTIVETLTIGPETLAAAAYQTPYSQQLTASGGNGTYTFSLVSGNLPYYITPERKRPALGLRVWLRGGTKYLFL